MTFLNRLFKKNLPEKTDHPQIVKISADNIKSWGKFETLLNNGKVKFDSKGTLRYLHGAPVGDLILVRLDKNGNPVYKESAEEWFDPESLRAKQFVWP